MTARRIGPAAGVDSEMIFPDRRLYSSSSTALSKILISRAPLYPSMRSTTLKWVLSTACVVRYRQPFLDCSKQMELTSCASSRVSGRGSIFNVSHNLCHRLRSSTLTPYRRLNLLAKAS